MKTVRRGTWGMLAFAAGSVALAYADPWASDRIVAPLTSNRSEARRLLPMLGEADPEMGSIVLTPPSGPAARIVADEAGGHRVFAGDEELGPADPDAVEGLWSSLRMATTLRAVADGADAGLGEGGSIDVEWLGQHRRLELGRATADEAGVYGVLHGGVEGTQGVWVVEHELSLLIAQSPRAWLARRAVVVEPSQVDSVRFADGATLTRGADGLWRDGVRILDPDAVRGRIDRLASARLDPLVPREGLPETTPWITLDVGSSAQYPLALAGPCPGRAGRVVVVRGPGLAGCIDLALAQPWPLAPLVHQRLLPHGYGEVLSVAQHDPQAMVLARHGGGWRIEETLQGREVATEVDEPEVFRWYGALHDAEVDAVEDSEAPEGPPVVTHTVRTEYGVELALACWATPAGTVCRRDRGPWLQVRGASPQLVLSASMFADRRIVDALTIDDVRAVEITGGQGQARGRQTRRQSVHFDLGVWRMDAPNHPEGDDALDTTSLDALIAAVAGLRAEAWSEPPSDAPLRTIVVDQVARAGAPETVEVALHAGCIAVVGDSRPALLPQAACRRLSTDLLFADPLAAWLQTAASVEIDGVPLQRAAESWVRADGEPLGALSGTLAALQGWRSEAVLEGDPAGVPIVRVRVRPRKGAAFGIDVGDRWVRVEGADWRYEGPPVFAHERE